MAVGHDVALYLDTTHPYHLMPTRYQGKGASDKRINHCYVRWRSPYTSSNSPITRYQ
ncbi:hypothetical protein PISMIDRAFT_675362, partial [Pisolithus microcarpus 441]